MHVIMRIKVGSMLLNATCTDARHDIRSLQNHVNACPGLPEPCRLHCCAPGNSWACWRLACQDPVACLISGKTRSALAAPPHDTDHLYNQQT